MQREKTKYERVRIDTLHPYHKNARTHSNEQIEKIAKSIEEFGFINPVLIDRNNVIIAGHGRVLAAKKLGFEEIPVILVEHLTEEQKRAYIIADNKLAEESGWDMKIVSEELAWLNALEFDTEITGFDLDFGSDWFSERTRYDNKNFDNESEEYKEFLEKFEEKRTTDDCYTPDNIYKAVEEYVARHYGLDEKDFVRPFYPGGDYRNFAYTNKSVVVDNPPFSILSEIRKFYLENGIKYFLFAPALTVFTSNNDDCSVCVGCTITYENGATVNTSFITNMEQGIVAKSEPELRKVLDCENEKNFPKKSLPKYVYPSSVITSTKIDQYSKAGIEFEVKVNESHFIRSLDSQKEIDKSMYGNGYILSEKATERVERVERERVERVERERVIPLQLSEREKEIQRGLK